MIRDKKVLALIPARGGSKRLPRKNVKNLCGKPLIAWSIEAAIGSKYVDEIFVSTDDDEVIGVAEKYGLSVPFKRPKHLASDVANTNDVILHVIKDLKEIDKYYNIIVILQPTSPLRESSDIDESLEMLQKDRIEGVVSVCECEHSPQWANELPKNRSMANFIREDIVGKRSQDLAKYYRLNGSIYSFNTEYLIYHNGVQYNEEVYAYEMSKEKSIDIDEQIDFQLCEFILSSKKNNHAL